MKISAAPLLLMAYALIALTLAKIAIVVFMSPIMGYANNYDFARQSSCVGIWQNYSDRPQTAANIEAPVNSLIYTGHKERSACMRSIDNLNIRLARAFHQVGDILDFREISLWKLLIPLTLFGCLFATVEPPAYKLGLATALFLIFGDAANLFYANTLYLEFTAVGGLLLATCCALALCSTPLKNHRAIYPAALSLGLLGFCKQQYMPVAIGLALLCALALWRIHSRPRLAMAFVLGAVAIPLIYGLMNNPNSISTKTISFVNKTNTFFWAVLPAAKDPQAALKHLGLPEHCSKGIGLNWYTPGVAENHPCPELASASRVKLLTLFIKDPDTLLLPLKQAVTGIHPFYPTYLGHLEAPDLADSGRYWIAVHTSLAYYLGFMSAPDTVWLFMASLGLSLVTLSVSALYLIQRRPLTLFIPMIGLGGALMLYSAFSSVFGDGYVDMPKHSVGFLVGLAFQLSGLLILPLANRETRADASATNS